MCLWQNALELNHNPSSSPIGWRCLNDPSSAGWRHLNDPSPLPQLIFDSRSGSSPSSLRQGYSQSGASISGWFQISVLEMSLEKEAFHQWLPCAFKNLKKKMLCVNSLMYQYCLKHLQRVFSKMTYACVCTCIFLFLFFLVILGN